MKRIYRLLILLLILISSLVFMSLTSDNKAENITLTITMAESPYIEDASTNYYKTWLEEQTGYTIIINTIPTIYSASELENSLASGILQTDIIFAFDTVGTQFFSAQNINELGQAGLIYPLDGLIKDGSNLSAVISDFTDYNLADYLVASDGHLYYMPQLDASSQARASDTLWINKSWLSALDYKSPSTTEELLEILIAFSTSDPNGNGLLDEVAFASSESLYPCAEYLINCFVYNEPDNLRMYYDEDGLHFAPLENSWRDAMVYLSELYNNEEISCFSESLSTHQLSELASSAGDVLGMFTTNDISTLLWNNHSDILMRYTPVSPMSYAPISSILPSVSAIIPSTSENYEAALELLDLMLSGDASLIACYGEEGVDWTEASAVTLDSNGNKASIVVYENLDGLAQNKNFAGIGPYYLSASVADHVSYSSFDTAYLNNRALIVSEAYMPSIVLAPIDLSSSDAIYYISAIIEKHTALWMEKFFSGEADPADDETWTEYIDTYYKLGIVYLMDYIEENTAVNFS